MSSLGKNRSFDIAQIQMLLDSGIQMADAFMRNAEQIEGIISKLQEVYGTVPGAARNDQLLTVLGQYQGKMNRPVFQEYRDLLEKILEKLISQIPAYDRLSADMMAENTAVTEDIISRIQSLSALVGSGDVEGNMEIFQRELFELQKLWEMESSNIKQQLATLAARMKGLDLISALYSKDPVNLSTGNFVYEREDIKLKGRVPLSFKRTYNSVGATEGILGLGWIHNEEGTLEIVGENKLLLTGADGKEETFLRKEEQLYVELYEQSTYIRQVTSETSDGSSLSYTYDEEGHLTTVTDHTGRAVQFLYRDHRIRKAV